MFLCRPLLPPIHRARLCIAPGRRPNIAGACGSQRRVPRRLHLLDALIFRLLLACLFCAPCRLDCSSCVPCSWILPLTWWSCSEEPPIGAGDIKESQIQEVILHSTSLLDTTYPREHTSPGRTATGLARPGHHLLPSILYILFPNPGFFCILLLVEATRRRCFASPL